MIKKVIFLDIDGVIQPIHAEDRFKHIPGFKELSKELSQKYGIDYCQYHPYDIGAVYYDWDKECLAQLQRIVDTTDAKIVISSDWRMYGLERMVHFFKIYGMDEYVTDITTLENIDKSKNPEFMRISSYRSIEILLYVERNPSIKSWVAIDDRPLDSLGNHFVRTEEKMTKEDADKCIEILNR
jgi:hypothetical protein